MSSVISLSTTTAAPVASDATAVSDSGPVQLSFPAYLRNAALSSRFAHLTLDDAGERRRPPAVSSKKVLRRGDNEGKRWVRRKENDHFAGNPHIAVPSRRDLEPMRPTVHATFPVPLPPYLPRSVPAPAASLPMTDAQAASAGRFALSLRGMRKALRRAGPRTQALVRGVEEELTQWLEGVQVVTSPDDGAQLEFPGREVGGQDGVREVQRSAARLVWWIEDDAWARYVVHCCARFHEVVSFSKDTPTHRLTYLLRPNVTRPDPISLPSLVTPPTSDLDLSSYDSDLVSSLSDIPSDALSDIVSEADLPPQSVLSDVASDAGEADVESGSVASLRRSVTREADAWSVDADSLASAEEDTPRPRRAAAFRTRVWDRTARSGSSPSRSPARRMPLRRPAVTLAKPAVNAKSGQSFYEYLFN
ncbi:hypothetical protein FA95DRAFT_1680166 [Auriscalpium vulgare]|uniref:Uncharacterized protein n=1 Tax=Auriscalpium vulgare TaxID=40419 RepID=A0ACB8RQ13_9AGAM|nr:hypothetical protein FA95DRAFT_1680166 [Auriscalpium vulgare]